MALVHDTSSECTLQMYEVSFKKINGYEVIEWTRNSITNEQRVMTPKYTKQGYGSCA